MKVCDYCKGENTMKCVVDFRVLNAPTKLDLCLVCRRATYHAVHEALRRRRIESTVTERDEHLREVEVNRLVDLEQTLEAQNDRR